MKNFAADRFLLFDHKPCVCAHTITGGSIDGMERSALTTEKNIASTEAQNQIMQGVKEDLGKLGVDVLTNNILFEVRQGDTLGAIALGVGKFLKGSGFEGNIGWGTMCEHIGADGNTKKSISVANSDQYWRKKLVPGMKITLDWADADKNKLKIKIYDPGATVVKSSLDGSSSVPEDDTRPDTETEKTEGTETEEITETTTTETEPTAEVTEEVNLLDKIAITPNSIDLSTAQNEKITFTLTGIPATLNQAGLYGLNAQKKLDANIFHQSIIPTTLPDDGTHTVEIEVADLEDLVKSGKNNYAVHFLDNQSHTKTIPITITGTQPSTPKEKTETETKPEEKEIAPDYPTTSIYAVTRSTSDKPGKDKYTVSFLQVDNNTDVTHYRVIFENKHDQSDDVVFSVIHRDSDIYRNTDYLLDSSKEYTVKIQTATLDQSTNPKSKYSKKSKSIVFEDEIEDTRKKDNKENSKTETDKKEKEEKKEKEAALRKEWTTKAEQALGRLDKKNDVDWTTIEAGFYKKSGYIVYNYKDKKGYDSMISIAYLTAVNDKDFALRVAKDVLDEKVKKKGKKEEVPKKESKKESKWPDAFDKNKLVKVKKSKLTADNKKTVDEALKVNSNAAPSSAVGTCTVTKATFQGLKMAVGEVYDMNQFTIGHKTLPYGTNVLVTDTKTKRQIIAVVKDRGPFFPKNAIVQLSTMCAYALGATDGDNIHIAVIDDDAPLGQIIDDTPSAPDNTTNQKVTTPTTAPKEEEKVIPAKTEQTNTNTETSKTKPTDGSGGRVTWSTVKKSSSSLRPI